MEKFKFQDYYRGKIKELPQSVKELPLKSIELLKSDSLLKAFNKATETQLFGKILYFGHPKGLSTYYEFHKGVCSMFTLLEWVSDTVCITKTVKNDRVDFRKDKK
jgi:hypothetical protein